MQPEVGRHYRKGDHATEKGPAGDQQPHSFRMSQYNTEQDVSFPHRTVHLLRQDVWEKCIKCFSGGPQIVGYGIRERFQFIIRRLQLSDIPSEICIQLRDSPTGPFCAESPFPVMATDFRLPFGSAMTEAENATSIIFTVFRDPVHFLRFDLLSFQNRIDNSLHFR